MHNNEQSSTFPKVVKVDFWMNLKIRFNLENYNFKFPYDNKLQSKQDLPWAHREIDVEYKQIRWWGQHQTSRDLSMATSLFQPSMSSSGDSWKQFQTRVPLGVKDLKRPMINKIVLHNFVLWK